MGTLVILEGGDGSGKATQTQILKERLEKEGYQVMAVSFPDYGSPSSALVKMYLAGEFGKEAGDVSPYVASTFYAADRYASFRMKWKTFYDEGGIVLADRYTTSNMVHQMVKYKDALERETFLSWLEDLEFDKFGLPRPDLVCLLDVPMEMADRLMEKRQGKTGGMTGDIHEKNREYLKACHDAYEELVERYQWVRINCVHEGNMRPLEDIHKEVYHYVKILFGKDR